MATRTIGAASGGSSIGGAATETWTAYVSTPFNLHSLSINTATGTGAFGLKIDGVDVASSPPGAAGVRVLTPAAPYLVPAGAHVFTLTVTPSSQGVFMNTSKHSAFTGPIEIFNISLLTENPTYYISAAYLIEEALAWTDGAELPGVTPGIPVEQESVIGLPPVGTAPTGPSSGRLWPR